MQWQKLRSVKRRKNIPGCREGRCTPKGLIRITGSWRHLWQGGKEEVETYRKEGRSLCNCNMVVISSGLLCRCSCCCSWWCSVIVIVVVVVVAVVVVVVIVVVVVAAVVVGVVVAVAVVAVVVIVFVLVVWPRGVKPL